MVKASLMSNDDPEDLARMLNESTLD